MIRFLADENLRDSIVRGVKRWNSSIDILRALEVSLGGADDQSVLEWAAQANRVLLTHDVNTITRFAYERLAEGKKMPGVFAIAVSVPVRTAIEDILLIAEASIVGEWEGQVRYIPLS